MALKPIDYYDAASWATAEHGHEAQPRERVAIELLQPRAAREGGALLDVGCGSGQFLRLLDQATGMSSRGWELHGVDFSEHVLEMARELPYTFEQCNLEEGIPRPDASFDVVYAGEVIEHVYNPDLLLRECHRVLKPGGLVLLTTPNIQAWYNRLLFAAGIQPLFYETSTKTTAIGAGPVARIKRGEVPVGHLRLFNRRALLDILESEGFRPLELRGEVFPAFPGPVRALDALFARRPSLSSIFIVLAEKA